MNAPNHPKQPQTRWDTSKTFGLTLFREVSSVMLPVTLKKRKRMTIRCATSNLSRSFAESRVPYKKDWPESKLPKRWKRTQSNRYSWHKCWTNWVTDRTEESWKGSRDSESRPQRTRGTFWKHSELTTGAICVDPRVRVSWAQNRQPANSQPHCKQPGYHCSDQHHQQRREEGRDQNWTLDWHEVFMNRLYNSTITHQGKSKNRWI